MALLNLTPDMAQQLAARGLFFAPGTHLHMPLAFAPPVRLYGGSFSHQTRIDAFSYVAPGAGLHGVSIGRYCSIGDGVAVLSGHPTDRLTTHPLTYESIFGQPFVQPPSAFLPFTGKILPTTIGHDVWIGAGVKLKAGVSIGDGCIVGAGSVVTKDIAPYSIVGGVPAALIRPRFDAPLVARLQQVQWWRYNLLGLTLPWDDVAATLDEIERMVGEGTLTPYTPRWVQLKD